MARFFVLSNSYCCTIGSIGILSGKVVRSCGFCSLSSLGNHLMTSPHSFCSLGGEWECRVEYNSFVEEFLFDHDYIRSCPTLKSRCIVPLREKKVHCTQKPSAKEWVPRLTVSHEGATSRDAVNCESVSPLAMRIHFGTSPHSRYLCRFIELIGSHAIQGCVKSNGEIDVDKSLQR